MVAAFRCRICEKDKQLLLVSYVPLCACWRFNSIIQLALRSFNGHQVAVVTWETVYLNIIKYYKPRIYAASSEKESLYS